MTKAKAPAKAAPAAPSAPAPVQRADGAKADAPAKDAAARLVALENIPRSMLTGDTEATGRVERGTAFDAPPAIAAHLVRIQYADKA